MTVRYLLVIGHEPASPNVRGGPGPAHEYRSGAVDEPGPLDGEALAQPGALVVGPEYSIEYGMGYGAVAHVPWVVILRPGQSVREPTAVPMVAGSMSRVCGGDRRNPSGA